MCGPSSKMSMHSALVQATRVLIPVAVSQASSRVPTSRWFVWCDHLLHTERTRLKATPLCRWGVLTPFVASARAGAQSSVALSRFKQTVPYVSATCRFVSVPEQRRYQNHMKQCRQFHWLSLSCLLLDVGKICQCQQRARKSCCTYI